MKRCFSFLLLLFASILLPLVAFGESTSSPTSPITTFHEIWDIPWDSTPEEFIKLMRERTGLVFAQDDRYNTLILSNNQHLSVFGYPADVDVILSDSTQKLDYVILRFFFRDPAISPARVASILKDLSRHIETHWAPPSFAYLTDSKFIAPGEAPVDYVFSFPRLGKGFDLDFWESHFHARGNINYEMFFDNLMLIGLSIAERKDFPVMDAVNTLAILAYSPAAANNPRFIPLGDILPYDQFASLIPPTPAPTPTPGFSLSPELLPSREPVTPAPSSCVEVGL